MMTPLEETLRESEDGFRSLFEAAALGIVVVGQDGQILQVNSALEYMFGYMEGELVGRSLELLLPKQLPVLHTAHHDAYARASRTWPLGRDRDLLGRRKDGQTFPVEVSLSRLWLKGQAVFGAVVADITERKRIEQERDQLLIQEQATRATAEADRRYIAMLAITSQAFNATSMDLQAVLDTIVRRTAEAIGDACTIRLLTSDGRYLALGASYHPDPEAHTFLQTMLVEHPQRIGEGLNGSVVLTGQPLLIPVAAPEQVLAMVKPEYGLYIERFGVYSCVIVPLRIHGQVIGTLAALRDRTPKTYTEHDQVFLQDLSDRAALAIHNARLFEQVRVGRERLQALSRQLVRAQEDERQRLAHELHDEIGQSLTAAQLNLQLLLGLPDRAELSGRLEDSLALIDRVLQQVRALSLDLRPAMLDDLGLAAALRWYVNRQAERAGLTAHFVAEPPTLRTSSELETTCFRIAQEALTNIVRHAQARQIVVELRQRDTELCLVINDDGIGFDVVEAQRRAAVGVSLGMLGMQERALLMGGQMTIESTPGRGTCVYARFPQPSPSGQVEPIERRKARR
jgi:PAS domain S-box-containing protein